MSLRLAKGLEKNFLASTIALSLKVARSRLLRASETKGAIIARKLPNGDVVVTFYND